MITNIKFHLVRIRESAARLWETGDTSNVAEQLISFPYLFLVQNLLYTSCWDQRNKSWMGCLARKDLETYLDRVVQSTDSDKKNPPKEFFPYGTLVKENLVNQELTLKPCLVVIIFSWIHIQYHNRVGQRIPQNRFKKKTKKSSKTQKLKKSRNMPK